MKNTLTIMLAALMLCACDDKKPQEPTPDESKAAEVDAPTEAEVADGKEQTEPPKPDGEATGETADAKKGANGDASPDLFDGSSPDAEPDQRHLINGLERMSPEDTKAALVEARPVLEQLAKKPNANSEYMPEYDKLLDPKTYTTRAYPVGEGAVFFLFRQFNEDALEEEVYKATVLYDRKAKKAAYFQGIPEWKREESYSLHQVSGVPMLLTRLYSSGGSCASGGTDTLYAVLPGGVDKALERSWDSTEDGGNATITVSKTGAVKVTSMPAVKKNKKKETFIVDKVEETCRFSNAKFTCVKKIVEKGIERPGCF